MTTTTMAKADGASPPVQSVAGLTTDDQTDAEERRRKGEFVRGVSSARNWITSESSSSSQEQQKRQYPPVAGRYHLYVAKNCPWCHRVLLGRAIMGLEDAITIDVLFPNRSNEDEPRGPNLWKFAPDGAIVNPNTSGQRHVKFDTCTADTVMGGMAYVKEIYEAAGIDDQKSVPILFDKETKTVVNNESAEILRMMGTVLRPLASRASTTAAGGGGVDLYPPEKRTEIDELNDWVYTHIANGSYKAGFSSNQDVYEKAFVNFFDALEKLNNRLASSKFLVGDSVTEADVRLFPPLYRHDPVYYARFKLNMTYLWEYRNIWRWMSDMVSLDGMDEVCNAEYLAHCKQGYFGRTGNGVIPLGPLGYPGCYKIPNWSPSRTAAASASEAENK